MAEWKKSRGYNSNTKRISIAEFRSMYDGEAMEVMYADRIMDEQEDSDGYSFTYEVDIMHTKIEKHVLHMVRSRQRLSDEESSIPMESRIFKN